eukprot:scaffold1947_cov77-Cyclotella_meneghiniana.AAC.4
MKSIIPLLALSSYAQAFYASQCVKPTARVISTSTTPGSSLSALSTNTISHANDGNSLIHSPRRLFLTKLSTTAFLFAAAPANAGIDPSALKALPVEGDITGATSRLRQIESVNGPRPEDTKDIPYEKLSSGASYREYREGKGDATIQSGSKVAVEMSIRCRSFATANEPGGLKYFTTKEDTDFNELAWTIGSGELPPELEEGMIGMKKGSLRRIELPSTVVYSARKAGTLPLPSEKNKDGKRRYENLFKTDATLLFEVLVTRIK